MESSRPNTRRTRFPAAGNWECSHVAWLPGRQAPPPEELVRRACEGLMHVEPGELREEGLRRLDAGDVELVVLPHGGVADVAVSRLRAMHGRSSEPGRLVEACVVGTLDERLAPLWLSLAMARGLALGSGGDVLDPGGLGFQPPLERAWTMPAQPEFVLVRHVMIFSSSDARGRGLMTTHGMWRLGMPELKAERLPEDALPGMAAAFNGLAWHLLRRVLDTPPSQGARDIEVPEEMVVQRDWIDASLGRAPRPVTAFVAGEPPPAVRLKLRDAIRTQPWLMLDPPRGWTGSRAAWARAIVVGLGRALQSPPAPPPRPGWDA